jgi:glutamate 5-kinase
LKINKPRFNRVTIKVGSNVVAQANGKLNLRRISHLVNEIAILYNQGVEVVLVTSGAVAAGRSVLVPSKKTNIIAAKQVWSAIGQVKLMTSYQKFFNKHGIQTGQVLTTKENFRDRRHYLNMKNCLTSMIENHVLPVVNENDTISINELMFTDNDELSGLISSMMDCESLILLSNVDGVFTGTPGCEGVELIKEINGNFSHLDKFISSSKSGFGRGGMLTKCSIAHKIASEGIDVFVANGIRDSIITDITYHKEVPFTHFVANKKKKTGVKKWLSHSETFAKGVVFVNAGAKEALMGEKATSLLMIGITKIDGFFKKGDIVRIFDEKGKQIGLGKSQYDSKKAEQVMGEKRSKPFIHYDYLVIHDKE